MWQQLKPSFFLIKSGSFEVSIGLQIFCKLDVQFWLAVARELESTTTLINECNDFRTVSGSRLELFDGLLAVFTDFGSGSLFSSDIKPKKLIFIGIRFINALRHLDNASLKAETDEVLGIGVVGVFGASCVERRGRGEELVMLVIDEALECRG